MHWNYVFLVLTHWFVLTHGWAMGWHPIACPWEWDMGCLIWVQSLIFVVHSRTKHEISILILKSGAQFTNDFSIVIQIQWKFHSALIQVFHKWLLWNFAHSTTAVLSWHVQKFVAIWYITTEWNYTQTNFPSNLNYNGKIVGEMGPRPYSTFILLYDIEP